MLPYNVVLYHCQVEETSSAEYGAASWRTRKNLHSVGEVCGL